jgi:hypothetical protein
MHFLLFLAFWHATELVNISQYSKVRSFCSQSACNDGLLKQEKAAQRAHTGGASKKTINNSAQRDPPTQHNRLTAVNSLLSEPLITMGIFKSPSKKRPSAGAPPNDEGNETDSSDHSQMMMDEEAQEAMEEAVDHEMMYEIVMRLREDPDFASTIYSNCPRLQHLLNERPDLRPVFEDPYLVRLNFEQVYRKAGGKFPEDEVEEDRLQFFKTALSKFVNSPIFKVLRALLLIKKVYSCISGNGFSMMRNVLTRCMCCQPEVAAIDGLGGTDGGTGGAEALDGADDFDGSPHNAELRESLYAAADHMEQPEVAEQMNDLLENDPEGMQEAIENDPDLRALRDSSPLCAELMSDPETMRVLVDPDNLRALADCPDLIEQDFADPNWTPPDIESGAASDTANASVTHGAAGADALADADANVDVDVVQDPSVEVEPEEGEVEAEAEGQEQEDPEFEMENDDNSNRQASKGNQKGKSKQNNQGGGDGGGGGGLFSQVTSGLTNMIAGEIVGMTPLDFLGGDDLGGLEDVADQAADDAANNADSAANTFAATAAFDFGDQLDVVGEQLDNVETGLDGLEDTADQIQDAGDIDRTTAGQPVQDPTAGQVAGSVVESAIIFGPCLLPGEEDKKDKSAGGGKVIEEDEPEKKKRFGFLGDFAGAVGTAAKESLLGVVLGSDLAEWAVEKQEEAAEKDDDDEENGDKKKAKGQKSRKK